MSKPLGKLYLIPCPIAEDNINWVGKDIIDVTSTLQHYLVERAKTSRQWLKKMNPDIVLQSLSIEEFNKQKPEEGIREKLQPLFDGYDMGLMSEAGNPCIADPGNIAVALAHEYNIEVIPLVGPSSFLLALIASGFNGQQFTFHGYLPNKKDELKKTLKTLEQSVEKTGYSQMFMEVPYRNHFMLETIIESLNPNTLLSISSNLNASLENIKTKKVSEWKKVDKEYLVKCPCVYLIGRI